MPVNGTKGAAGIIQYKIDKTLGWKRVVGFLPGGCKGFSKGVYVHMIRYACTVCEQMGAILR